VVSQFTCPEKFKVFPDRLSKVLSNEMEYQILMDFSDIMLIVDTYLHIVSFFSVILSMSECYKVECEKCYFSANQSVFEKKKTIQSIKGNLK